MQYLLQPAVFPERRQRCLESQIGDPIMQVHFSMCVHAPKVKLVLYYSRSSTVSHHRYRPMDRYVYGLTTAGGGSRRLYAGYQIELSPVSQASESTTTE